MVLPILKPCENFKSYRAIMDTALTFFFFFFDHNLQNKKTGETVIPEKLI